MSQPVLNSPAQLRRGAATLLPATADAPLIKVTPDLQLQRVWLDGSHSCDFDMPSTYRHDFLIKAFDKLVAWKESEGYALAPYRSALKAPDRSWRMIPGGRFWWKGPLEAIVLGKFLRTASGPAALRMTTGDAHLQETGGKVAYRVGSYFVVREHLAEVLVKNDH